MSSACKTKSQEPSAHETSAYTCAKCVMRDKSKIEESDESHSRWTDAREISWGEGEAACIFVAPAKTCCSAGQDDRRARLRARPHRSAHLRTDLKTQKCPHIPASHLRQHKTSKPSPPVDSPCSSPHIHTCGPDLQYTAASTISREGGQEGQAKCARGLKRALAFASRTKPPPRSFAVMSGP